MFQTPPAFQEQIQFCFMVQQIVSEIAAGR
jgi:hypothetical protein